MRCISGTDYQSGTNQKGAERRTMRTEYYRNLHSNPSIRLNWFVPLIKRVIETGKEVTTKEPLSLKGLDYTITFFPVVAIDIDGLITLTIEWRDEGQLYKQRIPISFTISSVRMAIRVGSSFILPTDGKAGGALGTATTARTRATSNAPLTTPQSLTGGTERNTTGESLHPTGDAV